MKGIGALLIALAVIYLIGWGSYTWIHGNLDPFGQGPRDLIPLLFWISFWGTRWLLASTFGIIYVLLHAVVQNDVGFLLWSFIGGIACVIAATLRDR